MLTMKPFLSLMLAWLFVLLILYASWSLARWLDPSDTTEGFLSAGGIIVALECLVGLSLLVLTIAYIFRTSIKRIFKGWQERR